MHRHHPLLHEDPRCLWKLLQGLSPKLQLESLLRPGRVLRDPAIVEKGHAAAIAIPNKPRELRHQALRHLRKAHLLRNPGVRGAVNLLLRRPLLVTGRKDLLLRIGSGIGPGSLLGALCPDLPAGGDLSALEGVDGIQDPGRDAIGVRTKESKRGRRIESVETGATSDWWQALYATKAAQASSSKGSS